MAEDMNSYENALIQRLVLRLPETDPTDDNLKVDRPAIMSSSVTRSPDAAASLGNLEALPLELLQHISEFLDFRAISRLRRTRTVTHASKALAALGKIGMMRYHSVGALYATLVSQECISCGTPGVYLSLPTCERFCYDCVCKNHAIRVAALEICGFTKVAADEIFSGYEIYRHNWDSNAFQPNLLDFAIQFIEGGVYHQGNATAYGDDWDSALEGLGIRPEKRQALLKAEHTDLRMRDTAEMWAKYIFETVYEWLGDPDDGLTRASAAKIQTVALPATPPQDHVMVYKGGPVHYLKRIWRSRDSDRVDFSKLYSQLPTDFSPDNSSLIYFAESKKLAHRYAKLNEDICWPVPAAVLHVAAPSSMINQATRIADEDFKQLAFKCLHGLHGLRIRRPNLQPYVKASLLLGPVCGNSSAQVEGFTGPDQITVVKMGGEEPLQYAFVGDAMALELNDKCNGKVWIAELKREGLAMYREA
ncbi:hypothetical protein LTR12_014835 [Friedmanniomyces endolithicus]|nr:hypothetical protein LTR74_014349 [Friedmanniomyces endolithicus]KAK1810787.1 hypothetical protein LTR12_014835 [Friedmanniomyces endolithicus]